MMKKIWYLFLIISFFSCKEENKKNNTHHIKVVEAHGYVVPQDSVQQPKPIPAGIPITVKAGTPNVTLTNTNIHTAGIPTVIMAGNPRVCTPGKDTFLLPKTLPAIDSPFVAGVPETVIAKDMANKDQNPQNFNHYGSLQGLKTGAIVCMLQDKFGNLWFGSFESGAIKYDGKSFTTFTDKEGLANNCVISIIEDKSGNLWFGTYGGGASKYDGKSFTTFTDREGLASNYVNRIIEDKFGNIWFGTYDGVSKYDGNCVDDIINGTNLYQHTQQDLKKNKKDLVKSFTIFTDRVGLANNDVKSILEDKSGNIWFGSAGGVSKYDGKSFSTFTDKEGLANNGVRCIMEDKSGNLWFGTDGGVSKYDEKSFTTFTEKEGLAKNAVFSILEDKSGNLWFGSHSGVSKYDGKSFTTFTEKEGFANATVQSILEDRSGNLWFGSRYGVSKYDGKSFSTFTEKEGLANNVLGSILEDKSGNLWFGTNGGGVSKYDGQRFTHFTDKEGLSNNVVFSMLEDKNGNLWFGTYRGGVSKYDGKSFTNYSDKVGLANNTVRSILEDKSGNLWFGTNGGVSKYDGKSFTTFSDKEGLANNCVNSIVEDKSGNIWFGTYDGISKYNEKSFTTFTDKDGLASNEVSSVIEDKSGNLWFGTYGGGVSKYNGKSFTTFTDKEGLANNTVLSMLEDKNGNLWFGTRFGLSKLTLSKLVEINNKIKSNTLTEQDIIFKNYSYFDGFLGKGVNIGKTICQAKDGTIWIAANDRLTAMHPENMPPDIIAPNIQLTTIELFNENIAWVNLCQTERSRSQAKDTTLTLGNGVSVSNFNFDGLTKWYTLPYNLSVAYNNNYLTFNFIGITMAQPKNVKYQYILEGLDENWSAITNKTSAPYGNLPPGNYTFKVKAMNSEGYWSKAFEYKFTIRPPFWQTWWFRTLIGLIIISSIWFYIKGREKKLVAQKEKLEKTVEERTAEVVLEKEEANKQRTIAEEQKHIIEEKHKEITDSINYAERIQRSFLATKELLDENLNNHFVFFKPKDVVSGDFYWASKLSNDTFALVTADSTGHGVPGAIMSLLNITSIESAIKDGFLQPSDILNVTRKTIIERLKKDGSADGGKDGMDCSLISFDFKNKKLLYAAANNPVWIIRDKTLIVLEADRMPIGKHDKDSIPFTQYEFDLQAGDMVYTLTDGFPDQFGGPRGKKFMYKQLENLLISISHKSMHQQKVLLEETFLQWKGDLEQVDDVCVIGVRV